MRYCSSARAASGFFWDARPRPQQLAGSRTRCAGTKTSSNTKSCCRCDHPVDMPGISTTASAAGTNTQWRLRLRPPPRYEQSRTAIRRTSRSSHSDSGRRCAARRRRAGRCEGVPLPAAQISGERPAPPAETRRRTGAASIAAEGSGRRTRRSRRSFADQRHRLDDRVMAFDVEAALVARRGHPEQAALPQRLPHRSAT